MECPSIYTYGLGKELRENIFKRFQITDFNFNDADKDVQPRIVFMCNWVTANPGGGSTPGISGTPGPVSHFVMK